METNIITKFKWNYKVPFKRTGCWEWHGTRFFSGYGMFRTHKTIFRAHRFSYEAFVGPIPTGLICMHLCNNPLCVNPFHLAVGTYRDNQLYRHRNSNKQRHRRGVKLIIDKMYNRQ